MTEPANSTTILASNTTKPIVMDALPYIDVDREDYVEYAKRLIAAEQQQQHMHSKRRATSRLPAIHFRSSSMKESYERVASQAAAAASNGSPVVLNSTRLDTPTALDPPAESFSVDEWRLAVNRARIAFESERIRGLQLEIDKGDTSSGSPNGVESGTSAADVWKRYIATQLEPQHAQSQSMLDQQRHTVERINATRHQHQQQVAGPLQSKVAQYHELVHKQGQLRQAIATLEAELSL